jgi:hypothetical protein
MTASLAPRSRLRAADRSLATASQPQGAENTRKTNLHANTHTSAMKLFVNVVDSGFMVD